MFGKNVKYCCRKIKKMEKKKQQQQKKWKGDLKHLSKMKVLIHVVTTLR